MNWFTILLTYLVIWWVVLFMVLPFGANLPEETGAGHSSGAPARTYLGLKMLVTSVLAAIVTWAFFAFTAGFLIAAK